jgi:predicted DNA-binding transcriptional regulator AlpA
MEEQMSEEVGFRVHRAHKMMDWIENEVTEWAQAAVFEHYGVEEVTELSRDQIEEVAAEADRLDEDYGDFISLGFFNIVRWWESESEDYVL